VTVLARSKPRDLDVLSTDVCDIAAARASGRTARIPCSVRYL